MKLFIGILTVLGAITFLIILLFLFSCLLIGGYYYDEQDYIDRTNSKRDRD